MNSYINCNIVNIVWIDRGILLGLISYIIDNYINLLDKNLIINKKSYRHFLRIIFNKLKIIKYKNDNINNFYFNIRRIIKNQDVIIDYLHNYDNHIETDKINLIPWYDMNDPIVLYQKNDNKLNVNNYKFYIKNFSSCRRGAYYNTTWDLLMERYIFIKYNKFNYKFSVLYIFNLLNRFILTNYTDTTNIKLIYIPLIDNNEETTLQNKNIETPTIVQNNNDVDKIEKKYNNKIDKINTENKDKINNLINILTKNINNINKYINI